MSTALPISAGSETGVLLIAHGSRRPEANADLLTIARQVQEKGGFALVEVAYLELTEPSIPAGAQTLVRRGATRVLMMPYFLSAGVHVVNDLEEFRRTLAEEHGQTEFLLCPHLGLHPLMIDIVLDRLKA